MIDARSLAVLDLLSRGYLVPAPNNPDYEQVMDELSVPYRVRLEAAKWFLNAVTTIDGEEPACSPSK